MSLQFIPTHIVRHFGITKVANRHNSRRNKGSVQYGVVRRLWTLALPGES